MPSVEDIKKFAREVLGCDCPEEVFSKIECQENLEIADNCLVQYKINIGGRLLVYLVRVLSPSSLEGDLERVVRHGNGVRDKGGFNRFRLVLFGDDTESFKAKAISKFDSFNLDDKIHLHIVEGELGF